jgi:hypothetical protein
VHQRAAMIMAHEEKMGIWSIAEGFFLESKESIKKNAEALDLR